MTIIDERTDKNSVWTEDDCWKNDLGYLLDHLSNILTDHDWNRLLVHTWVFQCVEDQVWYEVL